MIPGLVLPIPGSRFWIDTTSPWTTAHVIDTAGRTLEDTLSQVDALVRRSPSLSLPRIAVQASASNASRSRSGSAPCGWWRGRRASPSPACPRRRWLPPCLPPSGPRSTIQSANRTMTSRLCIDDDHGQCQLATEPVDDGEQAIDVGGVEAGGRLVHHVDVARSEVSSAASLRRCSIAAGEGGQRLAEAQISRRPRRPALVLPTWQQVRRLLDRREEAEGVGAHVISTLMDGAARCQVSFRLSSRYRCPSQTLQSRRPSSRNDSSTSRKPRPLRRAEPSA